MRSLWALALTLAAAPPAAAEWLRESAELMGTTVVVELWHDDPARGRALVTAALGELRRIDALMSTYRADSEISLVNTDAGQRSVVVGAELFDLIARALELSALSAGAFDITYEGVGRLYDFRAGLRPDPEQLRTGLALVDYRQIALDAAARTIRFGHPRLRINLGGIAKGYAVESAAALLAAAGIEHALLNAGGDTRVVGDRRGAPWVVAIRHPRAPDAAITRLSLADAAISTSGDYERYFEADGRRYHHIINPATGAPAAGVTSATVTGPDATLTDGLATAVFVLGVADGLALIESLQGYEAVLVAGDGRLHFSSGLLTAADGQDERRSRAR